MGGVAGGELAAQLAIDSMRRALDTVEGRDAESSLKAAIKEANRVVVLRRQNQAFGQMGTTVVAVIFAGQEVVISSVGDSRAYLVRGGAIQQLSKDHTFVQELVDKGEITLEEAMSHPKSHVLTRAIGAEPTVEVDSRKFWVWDHSGGQSTDYVVLCSDGLYSHVSDQEIAQIICESSPQRACAKLTELAKQRGGFDNITVAVIPLQGQLRKEPPSNYQPKQIKSRTRKNTISSRGETLQPQKGKIVFIWGAVAVLMFIGAIVSAVLGLLVLLRS